MQKHLSSRIARRSAVSLRSVVSAAAVLLTVVTPVAVAAPAVALPAATTAGTTAQALVVTDVDKADAPFVLGERNDFRGHVTNRSAETVENATGRFTVAYGKHVDAALEAVPADPSKVTVRYRTTGSWQTLALTRGAGGALQATFPMGDVKPGATVWGQFQVTVDRSVPESVTMGEVSVAGYADGTGARTVGFGIPRHITAHEAEVTFGGLAGRPVLDTGGKAVPFTATVTNRTGRDISPNDYFFIDGEGVDLDPEYVTLERRTPAGAWVPVRLGKQDQAVTGNLDQGLLKNGRSRTYQLRLAATKYYPGKARTGTFTFLAGNGSASFTYGVEHGTPDTSDPDVSRQLAIAVKGADGVTRIDKGVAREFTATVTNKGNISQRTNVLMEITDQDVKRRMTAGEIRVEQYAITPRTWFPTELSTSREGGHLMAKIIPTQPKLAPGESATYRLRITATPQTKAKSFFVDIEARAELTSTRKRLPFTLNGSTGTGPGTGTGTGTPAGTGTASPSAAPGTGPGAGTGAVVPAGTGTSPAAAPAGEMARTGSTDTTPLLVGATGLLVAGGAAALFVARRRAA
ncbi:LAETG motif-containing sortase-dependent surface protein [Streptomyces roseolilacinus]|uniref:Gram-positive cocci surface proteins LPxTG domain-containing protein n=1 Tax=Streptomyces roseolilacinus TaxID=66904 RepID=A0A918ELQ4_9ACTN|nr:LAETG motif-containing sortase-dependent surface protein [Streptomyces roseolilacinus]GGQ05507.1 hypothetical protein GCM10010249_24990 [Streptomyces roseolilacinus]